MLYTWAEKMKKEIKKDEMFTLEDEIRKQPWINIGFIVARFKWPAFEWQTASSEALNYYNGPN